jgi:hypothetical protein
MKIPSCPRNCKLQKKVSTKKPLLTREGVEMQKPGDLPDINLITKLSEEK